MKQNYEYQFKQFMIKNFPKKSTVLDVGTGINARHAIYLSKIFNKVYALDRDRPAQREKILEATKSYSNIIPIFSNIEDFCIKEQIDVMLYCWPERPIWKSMIDKLLSLKESSKYNCKVVIICLSGNTTGFFDLLSRLYFEFENEKIQSPDNKYLLNNNDLIKYLFERNVRIVDWSLIYSTSVLDYSTSEIIKNININKENIEYEFPAYQNIGFYNRIIIA